MKKLIPLSLLALVTVTALASCGGGTAKPDSGDNPATSDTPVEKVDKLFAISYNLSDPNMSGLWKPGLEKASVAEGFEKISLQDAKGDDAECLKMVEAAAIKDYDAFLVNVVDQTNGRQYVNKVKKTNKPLIFWNREVDKKAMDSYDKAYYVGIESAEGGRYQGAMAAEYVNTTGFDKLDRNGDGKLGVVVVRGEKGHPDAEARTQFSPMYLERNLTGGNKNATATVDGNTYKAEGFTKVDVKAIVDGSDTSGATWDPVTASTEVGRLLSGDTNKTIDLVLSNNDGMALGIITQTDFKKAGIPIWGVDALGDAIQAIKADKTQFMGTVKNDGEAQAKVAVKVARNLVDGKAAGEGLTVVDTKEAWEANGESIWYDASTKSFRVHHAKITKANA